MIVPKKHFWLIQTKAWQFIDYFNKDIEKEKVKK